MCDVSLTQENNFMKLCIGENVLIDSKEMLHSERMQEGETMQLVKVGNLVRIVYEEYFLRDLCMDLAEILEKKRREVLGRKRFNMMHFYNLSKKNNENKEVIETMIRLLGGTLTEKLTETDYCVFDAKRIDKSLHKVLKTTL